MTVRNPHRPGVPTSVDTVLVRKTPGAHARPAPDRPPVAGAVHGLAVRIALSGPVLLRVSVGLVFLWFGVLKLFPAVSPAEEVAVRASAKLTFGLLPLDAILPLLAVLETAIGIGLVTGFLLRLTLTVFFAHMVGVFSALFVLHEEMWKTGTPIPTMLGQYIIKNVVLVVACLVVAADAWLRALPHPGNPPRLPAGR